MTVLILQAPLSGWVSPLAEVPDDVFAQGMMGDGVAIDPVEGVLHAPCEGVVVAAASHAVTLRADNGAEILMHIGLETVALKGAGFTLAVHEGMRVHSGDVLVTFDLNYLSQHAVSLITPVLLVNEGFTLVGKPVTGNVTAGAPLFEVLPCAAEAAERTSETGTVEREVVIAASHGIHARPAARIATLAKGFGAKITLVLGNKAADARSTTALMGLGASAGARVLLKAEGGDCAAALEALVRLLETGLDGGGDEAPVSVATIQKKNAVAGALGGVTAVPGLAVGIAVPFVAQDVPVPETGRGVAIERRALAQALDVCRASLQGAVTSKTQAGIASAHIALLEDPELQAQADRLIAADKSAAFAWRTVLQAATAQLEALEDDHLRARVADLHDLERQVIAVLTGVKAAMPALADDSILLAGDLLPSELMALDRAKLKGIVTAGGGPTAHVAILAAGMNIPMLVAAGAGVADITAGTELLLDASEGLLWFAPDAAALVAAKAKIARSAAVDAQARENAARDCFTADGTRIEVFVNLGAGAEEAAAAVAAGGEGCGLLRTEFLFMQRQTPPDEAEQYAIYQAVADALGGRPLILRTFDIGADKPAPYLSFPAEDNPALGVRGVRAALRWPELLRAQLRAAAAVKPAGICRIMLPMIVSAEEVREVRALLTQICAECSLPVPPLGVMIETPSAALLADTLTEVADFFSIGSNDLTQYTLAIDRTHPDLAGRLDGLHPAVLRLVAMAGDAGVRAGVPVGLCGGLGADPQAFPILIGLGVQELSVPAGAVARLKSYIADWTLADCKAAAAEALKAECAADVRAMMKARLAAREGV